MCCLVAPLVVTAMRSLGVSTLVWKQPAVVKKSFAESLPRFVTDDANGNADGIYEDVGRAMPADTLPADTLPADTLPANTLADSPALIAGGSPSPPALDDDPAVWQARHRPWWWFCRRHGRRRA